MPSIPVDTFPFAEAAFSRAQEFERALSHKREQQVEELERFKEELRSTMPHAPAPDTHININPQREERVLTLYRDDSTIQVKYDRVKAVFWTANNTVLVISRYVNNEDSDHYYIHWPRERFCWFKDEPQ
jgi:hypothetical protein